MHELSIANAILELAQRHVPPDCTLKTVRVVAGPMRAIEPEAMQFAWQAVTKEAAIGEIHLQLDLRPWRLRCPGCAREFSAADLDRPCACGRRDAVPIGGDELQVTSIEVDEIPKGAVSCASR